MYLRDAPSIPGSCFTTGNSTIVNRTRLSFEFALIILSNNFPFGRLFTRIEISFSIESQPFNRGRAVDG